MLIKRYLAPALLLVSLGLSPALSDTDTQNMPPVVQHLTKLYSPVTPPPSPTTQDQGDPLGYLLGLQKRHWASAWVTSTFYDWRTISQYRRNAGLHLGYDIALPYGSPVSAGWAGTVTAIVPWTDTQYGVTVTSADGTEVTYGHISPGVRSGQQVRPGDIVGSIAADHVDVKMRDKMGRYLPFGEKHSAGSISPGPVKVAVSRNSILTTWLVANSSAQQAEEELFLAENASKKWDLERRSAEQKIEILNKTLAQLQLPESEGLVSRRRLEELKAEKAAATKQLKAVGERQRATPAQLRLNNKSSQANLKAIASWAKSEGLSWKDVENLVAKTLASSENLRKKVLADKASIAGDLSLGDLKLNVERGATKLAKLEELYLSGGLSKQEIEEQRLRQQLVNEEYDLRLRRKSK